MALGMLGLAYASVPLYRLFCQKTGYGGTVQVARKLPAYTTERTLTIRFNAMVDPKLPWKFYPQQTEVKVKLGQQAFALYRAENTAPHPIAGISTYNVTPDKAGIYFNKVECFCFQEQTLKPQEKVDMPLMFFIDPALGDDENLKDVHTITLSYTFFPYGPHSTIPSGRHP